MKKKDIAEKFVYLFWPQFALLKKAFVRLKCVAGCYDRLGTWRNYKMKLAYKIATASFGVFAFIIIFGWIAFPKILSNKIKGMVCIKKGNDVRDMYLKVPFPLVFKVYMFNVTNPVEVTAGAKPIVQEVGPFIYDEWKEKVDIVEDEAADTMEYTIKNTFIFNKAASAPLTGKEVITMAHPLLTSIVMKVLKDKPSALTLVNKALMSIFNNPTTPFITTSVEDILFNGVYIICNVTDFAGKAVCTQLKTEAKDLVEVEPSIYKFSLFGPKNGTKGQRLKVKRGIKDFHDIGRVVEYEGETELKLWAGEPCNTYHGSDSTIFPPFLEEQEGLVSFAPDICRSLAAYFVENSKYDGIPVRRYAADFGDMSTVEDEKCFCPTPETCLKKGVMDLGPCIGAPLIASLPHFYLSHESYVNSVKGLNPNPKDHEIIIFFEPMTGSPVSAKKRMQFSIPLLAVPKITVMKDFPETTLPLFWVEEGIDLNKTWTGQLKSQLFRVLKVTNIMKYLVLVGSVIGMIASAYMHFTKRGEATITPVRSEKDQKKDIISMLAQNGNGAHVNHGMSNEIDKY